MFQVYYNQQVLFSKPEKPVVFQRLNHQDQQTFHEIITQCECESFFKRGRAGSDAGQAQRFSGWDLPSLLSAPEEEKEVTVGLPASQPRPETSQTIRLRPL